MFPSVVWLSAGNSKTPRLLVPISFILHSQRQTLVGWWKVNKASAAPVPFVPLLVIKQLLVFLLSLDESFLE
jgi:hypothetical protein